MKNTIMNIPKGLDIQLTKNFNSSEFHCKCSYSSCNKTLIDLDHLVKLQALRDKLGVLKITSAYRCDKHNKAVGGSPTSQHLLGTATDIKSNRLSPKEVGQESQKFKGIGVYNTFVHIDSREGRLARWGKA